MFRRDGAEIVFASACWGVKSSPSRSAAGCAAAIPARGDSECALENIERLATARPRQ